MKVRQMFCEDKEVSIDMGDTIITFPSFTEHRLLIVKRFKMLELMIEFGDITVMVKKNLN